MLCTYKLIQLTCAGNKKMRRNLQPLNFLKIGVCTPVQLIGEKLLNAAVTKVARWQADGVDNDQVNNRICSSLTKIGGVKSPRQ